MFRLADALERSYRMIDPEKEHVGVEVQHSGLETPIVIPFGGADVNTAQRVMETIEKTQQSAKDLHLDEGLLILVTKVKMPTGAGKIHEFLTLISDFGSLINL